MCQIEVVSVCVKMGYFTFAQKLFDKMPHKKKPCCMELNDFGICVMWVVKDIEFDQFD